ncbi:MAG: hypothetical protein FD149_2167 [Rhodospirillaceae bacterium]|nr:MAG: hypothetical protein FD149_2167 [Rhodospirillaceae bacterium]
MHQFKLTHETVGNVHRVGPFAFGKGDADRRTLGDRSFRPDLKLPDAVFRGRTAHHHRGNVADINRPTVTGGDQQQADITHPLQRLAGHHRLVDAGLLQGADHERAVSGGDLAHELV